MKRRTVLASVCGTAALSGCSLRSRQTENGNIQVGNHTGQEVWQDLTVESEGGLFSEPDAVYDERTRVPPTDGYRATITDVAPPGTYEVQVEFEGTTTDQASGVSTTQWEPTGEPSKALIIALSSDFAVEFLTQ